MTVITPEIFEAALKEAEAGAPENEAAGLFGPGSPMWQISRESAVFLCAGRAALLQLAHPAVALAINQHSNVLADPRARFHRTFTHIFDMVFGNRRDALTHARQVRTIHDHINGTVQNPIGHFEAGMSYSANDAGAAQWVHATLAASALRAFEMVHGDLSPDFREAFWQDNKRFAALFGLTADRLPPTWTAFETWWQETLESSMLEVGPEAITIGKGLLWSTKPTHALPEGYIALTSGLLPSPIRDAFGLTFGPLDRRKAEQMVARVKRFYPLVPEKIKFVPGYHRAMARLEGKQDPDFIVRTLERIWLGG